MSKNKRVDSVANGGRHRARRERSPDRPQRYKFIAVQHTQRGQKHQHRQQRQGYPQRFVYPHRIAIRSPPICRTSDGSNRDPGDSLWTEASVFTRKMPKPPIGRLSKSNVKSGGAAVSGLNSAPWSATSTLNSPGAGTEYVRVTTSRPAVRISMAAHVHEDLLDQEIQLADARLRQARLPCSRPDELHGGVEGCGVRRHRQRSSGARHALPP